MKTQHPVTEFERVRMDLPHWQGPGATYFLRFSLRGEVRVDLARADVAPIVISCLRHFDQERYLLLDFVVMPDHVHCILKPLQQDDGYPNLFAVMDSLKHWTAARINRVLGRRGPLWRREQYDHLLRNQEDYLEKAKYIYNNPQAAGLVDDPADWPWWGIGKGVG
jgi:putative transposase